MRTLVVTAALCWLTATPVAAAWTQIQTPHYLFIGDASSGDMTRIARRFEQFHAVMQKLLSRAALSFSAPTVVVVFKNANSFRPYMPLYQGRPQEVAGIAITDGLVNYVAINGAGGDDAYPVIFHELAHLVTHNVSQNAATWLSEGIAEYYSSFELRGGKEVRLGVPLVHHVSRLREGQLIPLKELLTADSKSPVYNEHDRATLFYAQSWALVHFLVNDEQLRQRFADYMKSADRGLPHDQALTQALGIDLEPLEKALRRYVNQRDMPAMHWTMADTISDASMAVTVVDEGVALPHLAALLVRLNRPEDAEQRAIAALALAPRSAMAHAILADIRIEEQRSVDAATLLDKELAFNTFLDHYTVASALAKYIRLAGHTTPAGIRASATLRERITAATATRDDIAEAWRLASYAHLLANDAAQAGDAIERALALAPANESYRFTLVDILISQREFARARGTLGLLMARGRTADVRAAAVQAMSSLVRFEASVTAPVVAEPPKPVEPADPGSANRPAIPTPETLRPAFRTVESGETRVFGTMTSIECAGATVTVVVQIGARRLRITTSGSESIRFITYRDKKSAQVGCGPRPASETVYLTWRGADSGGDEIRSDSIVVELTPLGYAP